MIRWQGRSRRRPVRAMQGRSLSVWARRLALLVTAVGLVLMHHVVGAHQHAPAEGSIAAPLHPEPASASSTIPHHGETNLHALVGVADDGAIASAAVGTIRAVASASPAASLHDHSSGNGHDHEGSLLHLCLAALLGAAMLLALVVAGSRWRQVGELAAARLISPVSVPRAPPTTSRLAALQVLRL